MSNLQRLILFIGSISLLLLLSTCSDNNKHEKISKDSNTIRVGVVVGAEHDFMRTVKEYAAKEYDLNIQLVPYAYFSELNKALANKEIDANIFQNRIYQEYSQRKYGYRFSVLGLTYTYPMAAYAREIKNITQLHPGATIAIPNEPTNEARALFLLQKAGLIRMQSDKNLEATVNDIVANPSHFQFLRLPAKQIASVFLSADVVVLNLSYAIPAGLVPSKDDLVLETTIPAYASEVVVRQGEEKDPRLQALLEVLQSPDVEKEVNEIFHGQALPAWK